MARCRCGSLDNCGCLLAGGDGVTVSGTGNPGAPWVIDVFPRSTGTIAVDDTVSLDLTLTGNGAQGDPYVIYGDVNLDQLIKVVDTPDVDLTLVPDGAGSFLLSASINVSGVLVTQDSNDIVWTRSGAGTVADPSVLTADVACLECEAPGNVGDVLTLQLDGVYRPGPPVTAPVGAITVGAGLNGDGSAGDPLRINVCTYDDTLLWCPP